LSLEEKKEKRKNDPVWLTSFMDVLFILIAFFALYLSFTTIAYPPEISVFFRRGSIFEGSDKGKIELPDISPHLAETVMKKRMAQTGVKLSKGKEGEIVLIFPERFLFEKGSYHLKEPVLPLDKFAEILKKLPADAKVIIIGHTDNLPVKNGSNWELSARRAISVVEYLVRKGVKKEMLRAVGVADTQPLVEEKDERSRAINRRVEIKVYLPRVGVKEEKG
jgi:chemotaxis protein MotB